jgi:hypothetical protein
MDRRARSPCLHRVGHVLGHPVSELFRVRSSSPVGHRVTRVETGPACVDGRFSVNCWIGFR